MPSSSASGQGYDAPYADQQAAIKECGFTYADGIYISNINTCTVDICKTFGHNLEWNTERALDFMSAAVTASKPFFLYFNPSMPHNPPDIATSLDPASMTFDLTKTPAGVIAVPDTAKYCTAASAAACKFPTRKSIWDSTATGYTTKTRSSAASVAYVDASVGVLLAFLEDKKVLDNTIVIVTSDNGLAKGTVFEQGVRTNLFARWKTGGVAAGSTSAELVNNIDLLPTIVAAAGGTASPAYDTDGMSWLHVAQDASKTMGRDAIFVEMYNDRAVIEAKYKYVTIGLGADKSKANANLVKRWPQLTNAVEAAVYDVSTDGAEQTDISASGGAAVLAGLKKKLDAHKAATLQKPPVDTAVTLTCSSDGDGGAAAKAKADADAKAKADADAKAKADADAKAAKAAADVEAAKKATAAKKAAEDAESAAIKAAATAKAAADANSSDKALQDAAAAAKATADAAIATADAAKAVSDAANKVVADDQAASTGTPGNASGGSKKDKLDGAPRGAGAPLAAMLAATAVVVFARVAFLAPL